MANNFINGSLEDEIKYARIVHTIARLLPESDGSENPYMETFRKHATNINAAAQADPNVRTQIKEISESLNAGSTLQDLLQDIRNIVQKQQEMMKPTFTQTTSVTIGATTELNQEKGCCKTCGCVCRTK